MTSPDQYPRFTPPTGLDLGELVHKFAGSGARFSSRPSASEAPKITGVVIDNRLVRPGDIFAALSGENVHGIEFAQHAVTAGAAAVWTDPRGIEILQAGTSTVVDLVPIVQSDNPRKLIGPVAAQIMGDPSRNLKLVGVTGSNGKTTTSFLVSAALAAHYGTFALRGTVGAILGAEQISSQRTTAEAPELQEFFALMRERGIAAGVLEVSSHSVALHRIDGARFSAVGFTNLQRDHLDFHGTMEEYFQAKLALLHPDHTAGAVVNIDDEWGQRAAREARAPVETVSLRADSGADWRVGELVARPRGTGTDFTLLGPHGSLHAGTALGGDFNVANAALAIILSHRAGVPLETAAQAISQYDEVPGRMETIYERGRGPLAVVDYAHAPDSISAAIGAVRPRTPGRLIVVIASDGGRDEGKRPLMGAAAAEAADIVIVSDDNPRFEDPAKIRSEIIAGTVGVGSARVLEAPTRHRAVEMCAELAEPADTILLTGKGHETTQEIRGELHFHDDRGQIRELLLRKWS